MSPLDAMSKSVKVKTRKAKKKKKIKRKYEIKLIDKIPILKEKPGAKIQLNPGVSEDMKN